MGRRRRVAGGVGGEPRRGDIWRYRFRHPDKLRPVVIVSRAEAIPLLRTTVVAPVTSTIRGLPSEVVVGVEEGLEHPSAITCDHLHTIDQNRLGDRLGSLGPSRLRALCRAIAIATGCD